MCSGHIYHNFSCCGDLSKFGKEYLNSLKCQFGTFFSIKLRKFWHTARLSRTNRHKVIKSEKQSVFLAHPVYTATVKSVYRVLQYSEEERNKLINKLITYFMVMRVDICRRLLWRASIECCNVLKRNWHRCYLPCQTAGTLNRFISQLIIIC